MQKSPQAFRTIREVSDWLGVEAHVLRFWESKFPQIKPVKRAGGRRYYRPDDMRLVGGLKVLLHEDGMTIRGAQKLIREEGVAAITARSPDLDEDFETEGALDGVFSALPEPEPEPETAQGRAPGDGFFDMEAMSRDPAGERLAAESAVSDSPPAPEPTPELAPEPVPDGGDATPGALLELLTLTRSRGPVAPDRYNDLRPMVLRLEALADRLQGRTPS